MSEKLWGEIPLVLDTDSEIAALEREQITKPRKMKIDGPRLYQPINSNLSNTDSLSYLSDPYIDHTIRLLQYSYKVKNLILQSQENPNIDVDSLSMPPLMPTFRGPGVQNEDKSSKSFLNSEIFSYHMKKMPPEISRPFAKKLSRQNITVICAHSGFSSTSNSVLDFLSDLQQEYTWRICKLLRHSVDRKASYEHISYDDVLDKVFHDIGIGSIVKMVEFYRNRVIKYHKNVLKSCQALQEQYENIRNPDRMTQFGDLKMISIKEEPMMEIEFPTLDDMDEGVEQTHSENTIQLEELQSLPNIETTLKEENIKWSSSSHIVSVKQENSQDEVPVLGLEEEIINVSDSPPANDMPVNESNMEMLSELDGSSLNSKSFHSDKRRKMSK